MTHDIAYQRKVRFSDTDCQGHVFNANYFVYVDDAITDFLDQKGIPYAEILRQGHDMVLVRAECDFRSSARFGETVGVRIWVERMGNTSVTLGFLVEAQSDGTVVAQGREIYVFLDAATHRPHPVPDYARERLS
jgi:YbgC/YbaW family acyl-CoA thioester hydrolase